MPVSKAAEMPEGLDSWLAAWDDGQGLAGAAGLLTKPITAQKEMVLVAQPPFDWQAGADIVTAHGGLGLVGQLVESLPLGEPLNRCTIQGVVRPEISQRDVVVSDIGLLAQGKNDFDHIEEFGDDECFKMALGLAHVPSSPTLRQRLEQASSDPGRQWQTTLHHNSEELLCGHARCRPLQVAEREYVPLDLDVSPLTTAVARRRGSP